MRGQWSLIFGFIAALIIAVFAVINVEAVQVNYVFGTAAIPLILIILGSVLMGGVIVGAVGMVKVYQLQQQIKRLNQNDSYKNVEKTEHDEGSYSDLSEMNS
ncbi:LapA family protein [Bacillus alkalicellulosilyticus]|uniref:LapA family protein n=1 Tax=Alkalihalobacterium alkalicellulosilyticum TaxID=1912214 RepID=UPI00099673A1|nr:lipopolysaccharide assembly protein LapA domain-containing protein [Bacillus alkalicellulosilyticus]